MFKPFFSSFRKRPSSGGTVGLHKPFEKPELNLLYNLLFCDEPALFENPQSSGTEPWATLLAEQPDAAALARIAHDDSNEGRVRALAFNRLRAGGEPVPPKVILGVIVEVPLPQGLDVLAAFSEGGVRYINQSGKAVIFEGKANPVERLGQELVATAQPVVDKIGPWEQPRLAPPGAGKVRMTFLVSDGLYFGEGPLAALQRDPMAGPILARASELLLRVVDLGTKQQ